MALIETLRKYNSEWCPFIAPHLLRQRGSLRLRNLLINPHCTSNFPDLLAAGIDRK